MDYLGDKLTVAQSHVTQWMGTVRRSFQEALNLVTSTVGPERAGGEPSQTYRLCSCAQCPLTALDLTRHDFCP